MIVRLTGMARDNLSLAKLEDGSYVPAETAEERARALVPRLLEEQTINRGMVNAMLVQCGVDYQQTSFLPYMGKLRASQRYSEKQMAYLGLLHGLSVGMFADMELPEPCTGEVRERIVAIASSLEILTP